MTTPDQILARAQHPPRTAGPSARTRSSSTTAACTSSRGCRSAGRAASRCCSSTASSPDRGSGSATSATSPAAAGRATRSTSRTTTGPRRPTRPTLSFDTYTEDVVAALERLGPDDRRRRPRDGRAARAQGRRADADLGADPALARSCRATSASRPARTRSGRCRTCTGSSVIGWATLPEKLQRDQRDLTIDDVLRVQHLLGQKPHECGAARRQMLQGVPVDPRPVAGVPRLVIGGGAGPPGPGRVDRSGSRSGSGAEFEPFGAHSHYGLVLGEDSYQQVAESIRSVP